jgi:hypothetical protein
MAKKEVIVPPARKVVSKAAKDLPKGGSRDGRIVAESSVAKREGATRPKGR